MRTFILHQWNTFLSRFLSQRRVEVWAEEGRVSQLEFALQFGDYVMRKMAIDGIRKHSSRRSIPLLNVAVDDSVSLVSIAAMDALETLGHEQLQYFEKKRAFWSEKKKQEEDMLRKQGDRRFRRKKERSSSESYNDHKERAKKPVNTKFWM